MSRSAKSGVTSGVCTVSITATTAASAPEMSTAAPITRFARTPSSRAVVKSIDAARMCRPIVVRSSSSVSATRQTTATTIATIVILRMSTPEIVDRPVQVAERGRDLAERPEPEQRDALQQECDRERRDEHHRRRAPAQRPEDEAVHREREREHDREAEDDPAQSGQPHSDASASANAPAITSWP